MNRDIKERVRWDYKVEEFIYSREQRGDNAVFSDPQELRFVSD